ncbi:membrane protein insertase YidC [Kineosporia sp. A_224]|uniref:membrane protein insertase YidC n=1 Tax=Kineosporia sp. A_224 TaxID=1962180 RepID=UPI000B4B338E|nr:membrane protein insertase YidC [Kineosporia sp. A_224]
MIDFFTSLLRPLELAVAYIMVGFHSALTTIGMDPASGWTWALSIVGLVVVIRILLIPLFVKQIKASRGLQLIQPEMKKIQEKYKGKTDQASRQAMSQETMALYRDTGTNPLASCLPILLQSPIFFALFRVLNGIGKGTAIGPLDAGLVKQADDATLFGAQISDTFMKAGGNLNVQILTVVLIILMSASTFTTQRQLMMKNMPASALDNPFAQQQKILLYVFPVIFAVSGVNFPIGVLIYWLTTNVWSMGQQFYVIRRMPAPGSPAAKALEERRRRKGKGEPDAAPGTEDETSSTGGPTGGQRQQPKRQPKRKRTPPPAYGTPPAKPAEGTGADETEAGAGDAPQGEEPSSEPPTPSGPTTGGPRANGAAPSAGAAGGASKRPGTKPRRGKPSQPKR